MIIYAIDPGPTHSAVVALDSTSRWIDDHARMANNELLVYLRKVATTNVALVIEEAVSYGMVAGRSMFQTSRWAGRFEQRWADLVMGGNADWMSRPDVKLAICGSRAAKDRDIREELIHRYGEPGTRKAPGALYGIARDEWAALALGLAYLEKVTAA